MLTVLDGLTERLRHPRFPHNPGELDGLPYLSGLIESEADLLLSVVEAAAWPNWAAWADSMEARHEGIPVLWEKMRAIGKALSPLIEEAE